METYIEKYLAETWDIANRIDRTSILNVAKILKNLRNTNNRLFILGVGGSAGNASHAVNDFRKIAKIECYAPTDNVSELTAWTNDASWEDVFEKWLEGSNLRENDVLLILSVGGGSKTVSKNLAKAMDLAKSRKSKIVAIVSRDGGYAKEISDACVLVPVINSDRITPHAEGWQGIIWHLIVNAIIQ